jgi:hypothetical protein
LSTTGFESFIFADSSFSYNTLANGAWVCEFVYLMFYSLVRVIGVICFEAEKISTSVYTPSSKLV